MPRRAWSSGPLDELYRMTSILSILAKKWCLFFWLFLFHVLYVFLFFVVSCLSFQSLEHSGASVVFFPCQWCTDWRSETKPFSSGNRGAAWVGHPPGEILWFPARVGRGSVPALLSLGKLLRRGRPTVLASLLASKTVPSSFLLLVKQFPVKRSVMRSASNSWLLKEATLSKLILCGTSPKPEKQQCDTLCTMSWNGTRGSKHHCRNLARIHSK